MLLRRQEPYALTGEAHLSAGAPLLTGPACHVRWDTRRLGEPVEALPLTERGSEALLGAVCLDYSPTAGPTK